MTEEEFDGPDLVARTRRVFDALAGHDFDAALELFHADAVWESQVLEIRFEGLPAIRDFMERWFAAYAAFDTRAEDVRHVGDGIVLCVFTNESRPATGNTEPRLRFALVIAWADGLVRRIVGYEDTDQATADAAQLARQSR
jgi:ketosteroid isomerase-like protein